MTISARSVCWAVALLSALGGAATGQELTTEVRLADFGLGDASAVMRGRVAVSHGRNGPRLNVHFLKSDWRVPASAGSEPPANLPRIPPVSPNAPEVIPSSALWVWETRTLLRDPEARADFLSFVEAHRFSFVFLQLVPGPGGRVEAGFVPFEREATGSLVASLSALGVSTYALDGDPSYALPENHAGVLATVRRVLDHNAARPEEQRFAGIRFDIEPYLVPGFQGPRRQEILDGYVALASAVADIAREGRGGEGRSALRVGWDIPFWFDSPDEETGDLLVAEVAGSSRTVLDHLLSCVDDVAVMDYRTDLEGPDGSVAHALGEIRRADQVGVDVFVAVETAPLADEDLYTFAGEGWRGLPPDRGSWIALGSAHDGVARIWFVAGPEARSALVRAIGSESGTLRYWPAGIATRVSAAKQSFSGLGVPRMSNAAERLVGALARYTSFRGLAYHHYGSLRFLLEGR